MKRAAYGYSVQRVREVLRSPLELLVTCGSVEECRGIVNCVSGGIIRQEAPTLATGLKTTTLSV